jgi:hypothetical protein
MAKIYDIHIHNSKKNLLWGLFAEEGLLSPCGLQLQLEKLTARIHTKTHLGTE